MTLASRIQSDVTTVFMDTDAFAETVTFYPGGDVSQKTTFSGVVTRDTEEGTREAYGDGVTFERDEGTAIRESIFIECAAGTNVDPLRGRHGDPSSYDLVELANGDRFQVKRVAGRDDGTLTILCVATKHQTVRKRMKRG